LPESGTIQRRDAVCCILQWPTTRRVPRAQRAGTEKKTRPVLARPAVRVTLSVRGEIMPAQELNCPKLRTVPSFVQPGFVPDLQRLSQGDFAQALASATGLVICDAVAGRS
jgi:hypothetical protein